jgi:hypothetical protein
MKSKARLSVIAMFAFLKKNYKAKQNRNKMNTLKKALILKNPVQTVVNMLNDWMKIVASAVNAYKIMNKETFTGRIIKRLRKKVYDKQSLFYQQINYRLTIREFQEEVTVFVHTNKINPGILTIIEQKTYLDKRYRFSVKRSK